MIQVKYLSEQRILAITHLSDTTRLLVSFHPVGDETGEKYAIKELYHRYNEDNMEDETTIRVELEPGQYVKNEIDELHQIYICSSCDPIIIPAGSNSWKIEGMRFIPRDDEISGLRIYIRFM